MSYTREQLINLVYDRIDEDTESQSLAVIKEGTVGFELDQSANDVIREVPKSSLYQIGKSYGSDGVHTVNFAFLKNDADGNPYSILIPLKQEFLRMMKLRLQHWTTKIEFIRSDDDNDFINGPDDAEVDSPVAALVPFRFDFNDGVADHNFVMAIECFPVTTIDNTSYRTLKSGDAETAIDAAATAHELDLVPIYNSNFTGSQKSIIAESLVVVEQAAEAMPNVMIDAILWKAAQRCLTNLRETALAATAFQNFQLAMSKLSYGERKTATRGHKL
jgi:hypothetical protein